MSIGGRSPDDEGSPPPQGGPDLAGFIGCLTDSQGRLRAYLLAALGSYDDAAEVLQRTNLVLWRNAASFRPGSDFMPWALTLAKYEILSFYRDRSRDRLVFSQELAEQMMKAAESDPVELPSRQAALRECLKPLKGSPRRLIDMRYDGGQSIAEMARALGKSEASVKMQLMRVRRSLENCIQTRLQGGLA
ncbi:MAG: sigma-70 family RNA polymerase sigma factor [Lacipirellulaceae bacterium]